MGVSTSLDTNGIRDQFPGLTPGWHYLDTAATAQKPQAVIDATVRAMGADYATVHRGVYARSAEMTLAFEAARAKVAAFIGGQDHELVFTRGATEAINLVAQTWGATYFTSGSFGSSFRRRWATRRVKPQESIRTTTSGFSRAASATVSSTRAMTRR